MSKGPGEIQQKVLLLLLGGLALGLSGSPKKYFQIIKGIKEGWREIDNRALRRAIRGLYQSKLISEKQNSDGTITMILTDQGKKKALTYNLDKMEIKKPGQWDKKWRVVLFDIPNNRKRIRDALRYHLKNLGFYEFQESVFVHPYDCKDEIDYLIEFYDIRKFVRFIIAEEIDNELDLKYHFKII